MKATDHLFPFQQASELSTTGAQTRWLIEGLWTDQAVGILGGEPKCCKSFLALDIALSVASGCSCLRQFKVPQSGPVLLFPAEDSLSIVRERLEGICSVAGLALESVPLQVITAPTLRLDLASDRQRLARTVESLKPKLLVLDPLIRLHRVDENEASQIAPLLGGLRELQRCFELAVLLVHHAKKEAHSKRQGQALRGSSELHGWGDSNLYLRRKRDRISLTTEHRAARSQDNIGLQLTQSDPIVLELIHSDPQESQPAKLSIVQRILNALSDVDRPLSANALRQLCAMKNATLCTSLARMTEQGLISHDPHGYRLNPASPDSQIQLPIGSEGTGNGKTPRS
jgi:RecA-family ATPase